MKLPMPVKQDVMLLLSCLGLSVLMTAVLAVSVKPYLRPKLEADANCYPYPESSLLLDQHLAFNMFMPMSFQQPAPSKSDGC